MAKWFYYNESGEKIEVTGGQLKGLAKAGMITPDTIVETEEGKTAPARRVKGLTFATAETETSPRVESSMFTAEEQVEIDKFCATFGSDAKAVNAEGVPLLYKAVEFDNIAAAKFLVSKGADVNAKDNGGGTPLQESAYTGNVEIAKFLISKGAQVNEKTYTGDSSLHLAAYRGNIEVATILMSEGADIDTKNQDGITPLHAAADTGNVEIARALISARANVNAKNKDGFSPLHCAAQKGHIEVAKVLVSAGADVSAKNNSLNFTPLDFARRELQTAVIQYLSSISTPSTTAYNSSTATVPLENPKMKDDLPIIEKRLITVISLLTVFWLFGAFGFILVALLSENEGFLVLSAVGIALSAPSAFLHFGSQSACPVCKRFWATSAFLGGPPQRCKCKYCGYEWIRKYTDLPPPTAGGTGVKYTRSGSPYRTYRRR